MRRSTACCPATRSRRRSDAALGTLGGFGGVALEFARVGHLEEAAELARRAVGLQREGLAAAREQGLLRPEADPVRLAEQIYHGYEFACAQWAWGRLDLETFEARALYGLYVALLGIATDEVRPRI